MLCLDRPFHRAMAGALLSCLADHDVTPAGVILLQPRRSLRRSIRRRTLVDDLGRLVSARLLGSHGTSGIPLDLTGYRRLAGEATVAAHEAAFARFIRDRRGRVIATGDLDEPDFHARLESMQLDLLFAEGGGLLRRPFLNRFPLGVMNLHGGGPLPQYRGLGSLAFALIDGQPVTMTLHLVDEGIDTGPVLAQQVLPLSGTEDLSAIYARLMQDSRPFIARTVAQILAGTLAPTPQLPGAGHQYFAPHPLVASFAERRVKNLFTGNP
jgi:folate-dependent phosphoribosylglycinamide formyltransferase PurN